MDKYQYSEDRRFITHISGDSRITGTIPVSHPRFDTVQNAVARGKAQIIAYEPHAKKWDELRRAEYPTIQECVHALLDGGETLDALQARRAAVKAKYPKI